MLHPATKNTYQPYRVLLQPLRAEMKFKRRTAVYSLLDHKRNEDILEELK
jgi:hypothetical protein